MKTHSSEGSARPASVEDSLGLTPAQRKKERVRRRRRRRPPIETAGALVWRVRDGDLQVLLVHRPRYDDWSWPKGKVDAGESAPAAAVREVAEETGTLITLGVPLPRHEYLTRAGYRKRVHYWAAQPLNPADSDAIGARDAVSPVDPDEIDDIAWLPTNRARTTLTWPNDAAPLDALEEAWRAGSLATAPLVVVRHAHARKRADWSGQEANRPLTPAGYLDAARILPILSAYGIDTILTSEWRRCRDTILPYAHAAGIKPQELQALTEEGHSKHPDRVTAVVDEALRSTSPTLLCTHRPVLGTVLSALRDATRKPLRENLPARNPFLKPGSVLVAHVVYRPNGPKVLSVETYEPRKTRIRLRAQGLPAGSAGRPQPPTA